MLVEQRVLVAMLIALGVGAAGVHTYPVDRANVYLQIIELRNPAAFLVLVYGYATLWFTSTFFAASMLGSLTAIVAYRQPLAPNSGRCRPTSHRNGDPHPRSCSARAHLETTNGRAPQPSWLTIPQRGLYTGVMVIGAVGTGKTSACMFPYTDQLLRWKAQRSRAQDWRPCPRSQGRLLPAGTRHAHSCRTCVGLHRDSPRWRRLLQPAPQRPRSVRGCLCDLDAGQQPVRQVEGAVLAAGVHGSAQVRHPASAPCGRLHDPRRGVSLRPRGRTD